MGQRTPKPSFPLPAPESTCKALSSPAGVPWLTCELSVSCLRCGCRWRVRKDGLIEEEDVRTANLVAPLEKRDMVELEGGTGRLLRHLGGESCSSWESGQGEVELENEVLRYVELGTNRDNGSLIFRSGNRWV